MEVVKLDEAGWRWVQVSSVCVCVCVYLVLSVDLSAVLNE